MGSSGEGGNLPLFRWGILTQGAMVEPWEPQVQHTTVGKVLILWVTQMFIQRAEAGCKWKDWLGSPGSPPESHIPP